MKISKSERDSGRLSERNLKAAARTLKECGFVVIEDAISHSWVDRTRAACDRALNQCMEALTPEKREPLQRTNVPMFPPVCSPFMDAVAIESFSRRRDGWRTSSAMACAVSPRKVTWPAHMWPTSIDDLPNCASALRRLRRGSSCFCFAEPQHAFDHRPVIVAEPVELHLGRCDACVAQRVRQQPGR